MARPPQHTALARSARKATLLRASAGGVAPPRWGREEATPQVQENNSSTLLKSRLYPALARVGSTPQVDSTRASAESTPLEWSLEKSTLLSTTKFKIISSGVKLFTFNQKNNYLYINNCSSKLSFNKFLESLEELRKNSKNSSFYKLSKYQRSNQDTCI